MTPPPLSGDSSSLATWVIIVLAGVVTTLFSLYVKTSKDQVKSLISEINEEKNKREKKSDENRKEIIELHNATLLHISENSSTMKALYDILTTQRARL